MTQITFEEVTATVGQVDSKEPTDDADAAAPKPQLPSGQLRDAIARLRFRAARLEAH